MIEAFVCGLLWGAFHITRDVVGKIRRDSSKKVGRWRDLTFMI